MRVAEDETLLRACVAERADAEPCDLRSPRPARILVIDDEFRVRRVIAKTLSKAHQVVEAPSAEAALALLWGDDAFDLVLSDMVMPEMSGAELLDRLRAAHPRLAQRFAFVTAGASSDSDTARLRDTGVHLLLKPFTPEELLAFVAERLAQKSR